MAEKQPQKRLHQKMDEVGISEKESRQNLIMSLVVIAIVMLLSMFLHDWTRHALHPDITAWKSHLITIVFASLLPIIVAYLVLRRQNSFIVKMKKEVAEYKQKENAMQEREEKYSMILESIEDGYFEVDLAGNLTFCNDSLVQISGYSRDELLGMNNREYTTPEMAKKMYQMFSQVYNTRKPVKMMDYEVIKKDGNKIFLEMSTSLKRDLSGEPIGFRGILRDITERKEAEKALQESEGKYRTILESIEDGYYEVDINGNLTFFNDSLCKIYGRSKDELMGKNLREFTNSENAKAGYEVLNTVNTTGKPAKGIDWEILRKDGTKRYVEPSVSPIIDSKSQQTGFRGILRDITERKQMDEKVRKLLASFGEVWTR